MFSSLSNARLVNGSLCKLSSKGRAALIKGIACVPHLAFTLNWIWATASQKTPLGALTGKLECFLDAAIERFQPFADGVDGKISSLIIRGLQLLLQSTIRLADVEVCDEDCDYQQRLVNSLQSLQQMAQLKAELNSTQEELHQQKQQVQDALSLKLQAERAESERRWLHMKLEESLRQQGQLEDSLGLEEGRSEELARAVAELEARVRTMTEDLIQVENYKRSSHGEQMRRMEESLAHAQMRLVESEASKDELEMTIIHATEELERQGYPPLKSLAACREPLFDQDVNFRPSHVTHGVHSRRR